MINFNQNQWLFINTLIELIIMNAVDLAFTSALEQAQLDSTARVTRQKLKKLFTKRKQRTH